MSLEKYVSFARNAALGLGALFVLEGCAARMEEGNELVIYGPVVDLFKAVTNMVLMPFTVPYHLILGEGDEITVKKKKCETRDRIEYCESLITHKTPWDLFGSTSYDIITTNGQREYEIIGAERSTGDLKTRTEKILTLYLARDLGGRNMEGAIVELLVYEGKNFGDLKIDFINSKFKKEKWIKFRENLGKLDLSGDLLWYRFLSKGADQIVEGYGEGARGPLDEALWLFEQVGLSLEKPLKQN